MKKIIHYAVLVFGTLTGLLYVAMSLDSFPASMKMKDISGFLIHIVPALLIFIATILSFRYPKAGLVLFIILAVAFTIYFRAWKSIQVFIVVTLPLVSLSLLVYSIIPPGKN